MTNTHKKAIHSIHDPGWVQKQRTGTAFKVIQQKNIMGSGARGRSRSRNCRAKQGCSKLEHSMVGIMALRSATRTPAARMRVALYNTPALLLVAPLAAARAVTLRVAAAAARAVHHGELLRHREPRAQPHAYRVPNPLHLRAHVTVWQHAGARWGEPAPAPRAPVRAPAHESVGRHTHDFAPKPRGWSRQCPLGPTQGPRKGMPSCIGLRPNTVRRSDRQ